MVRGAILAVAVTMFGRLSAAAPPQSPCAHAKAMLSLRQPTQGGARALAARPPETSAETDVEHFQRALDVDPTAADLSSSNLMTVRSRVPALSPFRFRLAQLLSITAVLRPDPPLAAGGYALTLSDNVTSRLSGDALGGELSRAGLPSGAGSPGGGARLAFRVLPVRSPRPKVARGAAALSP